MAFNANNPYGDLTASAPMSSSASLIDPLSGTGVPGLGPASGIGQLGGINIPGISGGNGLENILGGLWNDLSGGNTLTGLLNSGILGLDALTAAGNIGLANTEGDILNQGYNLLKNYQNITPGSATNNINAYLAGLGPSPFQPEGIPTSLTPGAAAGQIQQYGAPFNFNQLQQQMMASLNPANAAKQTAQYGQATGLPQWQTALNSTLGPQNASNIINQYLTGAGVPQTAIQGLYNPNVAQTELNQYESPLNQNLVDSTLRSVQSSLASQGLSGAPGIQQAISQQALAPYSLQEQQLAEGQLANQQAATQQAINTATGLYGNQLNLTEGNYENALNQALNQYGQGRQLTQNAYNNAAGTAASLFGQNQGIQEQNYELNQQLANQQNLQRLGLANSDYWQQLQEPLSVLGAIQYPQPGGYASLINPAGSASASASSSSGGIPGLGSLPSDLGNTPTFPTINLPSTTPQEPTLGLPPYNPPSIAQPSVPPLGGTSSTQVGSVWNPATGTFEIPGAAGGTAAAGLGTDAATGGDIFGVTGGSTGLDLGANSGDIFGITGGAGDVAGDTTGLASGTVESTFPGISTGGSDSLAGGSALGSLGSILGGIGLGAGIPLAALELFDPRVFSGAASQETVNNIAGNAQTTNNALLNTASGADSTINNIISQAKAWEAQNPGKDYWQSNPGAAASLQRAFNYANSQDELAANYSNSIFGATGPAGGVNPTPTNYTPTQATTAISNSEAANQAAIESLSQIGAPAWMINAILQDQGSFGTGGLYTSPTGQSWWDWTAPQG